MEAGHSLARARLPFGHGAVDPDRQPILLPVVMKFGVDPVHFGMIMLLNLGIGLCHPPVGAILFVGCVTIEQVVREIWPFYRVMFFVLMLVTCIPSVSLWLLRMLGL